MSNYQFEERPASVILGRRGLFKVVGLCAVAAGATGWAVGDLLAHRNAVLLARQVVISLRTPVTPMDDTMYSLLHTHYAQRSQLAAHH